MSTFDALFISFNKRSFISVSVYDLQFIVDSSNNFFFFFLIYNMLK